jgi:hypothetical protein
MIALAIQLADSLDEWPIREALEARRRFNLPSLAYRVISKHDATGPAYLMTLLCLPLSSESST